MKYQVCNKKKKSHQFNVESGCLMGKKTPAVKMWLKGCDRFAQFIKTPTQSKEVLWKSQKHKQCACVSCLELLQEMRLNQSGWMEETRVTT